jgi:hypothetical protein
MHRKVFLKLKKTLNPLFWAKKPKKTQKKPKKPKKNQKKTKKPKKNHWAGFFKKKTGFFPTLQKVQLSKK